MKPRPGKQDVAQIPENQLSDVHPHHDQHLCHIVGMRNMKTAGKLAKDAAYLCAVCGCAAKKPENLCVPVKL